MSLSARGKATIGKHVSSEGDKKTHLGKHDHDIENSVQVNNLCPVSNSVSLQLVRERLATLPDLLAEELIYDHMSGSQNTRELVAHFLSTKLPEYLVSSDQVVLLDGPTSILNAIAFCLCEEGDRVLIPFECREELSFSFTYRAKVETVTVCPDKNSSLCDNVQNLEAAWQNSGAENSRIKIVYVTLPDAYGTGLGIKGDDEPVMLDHIVTWASSRGLHTITDITNALSITTDVNRFCSWNLIASREDVHILWNTSKFFNVPGASLCALTSRHKSMMKAFHMKLSYFGSTSRQSQWIIQHFLSDATFVDRYVDENRSNLITAHHNCVEKLAKAGIPYRSVAAGCPVLLDLGDRAKDNPELKYLVSVNDILVSICSDSNPGHVLLYYAAATFEELNHIVQNLRAFIWPSD